MEFFSLFIYAILSFWIIPVYVGSKRRIGYWWTLIACMFLSPLIGLIIALISPKKDSFKPIDGRNLDRNESKNYRDKFQDLSELRKSGILNDDEYNEKIRKLDNKITEEHIKNSESFIKIKNLHNEGILSKEEFELKKKLIEKTLKEEISSVDKKIAKVEYEKTKYDLLIGSYRRFKIEFKSGRKLKYYQHVKQEYFFIFDNNQEISKKFQTEKECQIYLANNYVEFN